MSYSAFGRKVVGQVSPTATVGQEVKDGVQDFSHVGGAWSSAGMSGNKGTGDFPLGIGQVGSVGFSDFDWVFH